MKTDFWFVGGGLALVMAVYGLAGALDAMDAQAAPTEADVTAAYEDGVKAGRAAALATVRAAWQAGLREAQERCAAPATAQLAGRR